MFTPCIDVCIDLHIALDRFQPALRSPPAAGRPRAPPTADRRTGWGRSRADLALGEREIWADAAKGVCILLVVLWHVVEKHYSVAG